MPPPTINAASVAAIAPYTHVRGWRTSRSISSRFGTASSATESYLACSASAIARHDCTRAMAEALHADRKSTRLNSSHLGISYAVFCLKKKKKTNKKRDSMNTESQNERQQLTTDEVV